MENKKTTKTVKKPTKTVSKKITKNTPKTTTSKKKKGFTLIELLAVIIILGILMIIAIPSVTKYISDSRKSAYVDTAKEIVSGTRNMVNEGNLGMYDTGTTYYIPSSYIKTENASKSPYGEFTQAYVGVTYNGSGYDYYWISTDDAGQGIKYITKLDLLDEEDIVSDLSDDEIENRVKTTGIDGRSKILILDENGNWSNEYYATGFTVGKETEEITYPSNKEKDELSVGDIVTIGTEEFYVVKNNGNDVTLLARYNLKVGKIYDNSSRQIIGEYTPSDPGYGMQSNEVKGYVTGSNTSNGVVAFSESDYWDNPDGTIKSEYPGVYDKPNFVYVYDNNSSVYQYVNNYAKNLGINVKEARLIKSQELVELGCVIGSVGCTNAPDFVTETSYWTGSATSNLTVLEVASPTKKLLNHYNTRTYTDGRQEYIGGYVEANSYGLRPVIVI